MPDRERCPYAGCPICDDPRRRGLARFAGVAVVRCRGCGLVYVASRRRAGGDRAVSDAYYEGWDLQRYADYYGPFRRRVFERSFSTLERLLLFGDTNARRGSLEATGAFSVSPAPDSLAPRVLDVGCSFGWFLDVARGGGWEAVGLEPSREVAARARESYGLNVMVGGVAEIPLVGGAFDVVTLWNVLEHLAEPRRVLGDVRSKLKPGGLLAISVPNLEGLFTRLSYFSYNLTFGRFAGPLETLYQAANEQMHLCHYSPRTLVNLLERLGFEVLEITQQEIIDVANVRKRAALEGRAWARASLLGLPVALVFHLSRWLRMGDEIAVYARRT